MVAASILASTELILRVARPTPGVELVFYAGLHDAPEGLAPLLLALALVVVAGAAPRQVLGAVGVGLALLDLALSAFGNGEAARVLALSGIGLLVMQWPAKRTVSCWRVSNEAAAR